MSTKSLPRIQTHINCLFIAGVLIGDDGLLRHTIVCHCYNLAAQPVVLSLSILVKEVRRHRNQWHLRVDFVFEVSAQSARAVLPKSLAAV